MFVKPRRTDCLNRLRQQGLAVLNYESAAGHLPPGAVQGPFTPLGIPAGAGHGLWVFLLPHLDQSAIANRYHLNLPYNHPDNQPAAAAQPPRFSSVRTPSGRVQVWDGSPTGRRGRLRPLEVNPFLADIGLIDPVAHFESVLPANEFANLNEITHGTSNTILLAEAGGRPGMAWSSPLSPVDLREVFGGSTVFHRGGSPGCMADGSARFFSTSMSLLFASWGLWRRDPEAKSSATGE